MTDYSKKEDAAKVSTGFSDTSQKTQARNTQSEALSMPKRMKGSVDIREWLRFMEDPRTKAATAALKREVEEEMEEERRSYDGDHDLESDKREYVRQLIACPLTLTLCQAEEVKNG